MIIIEKDNLDRVIFEIIFENSGAIFNKEGVVNFLAHTFKNRGTAKDNDTKFLEKLDNNGIHLSVASGWETITFHLSFLREKQNIALKLLKELLVNPNFSEAYFNRGYFYEEINEYEKSEKDYLKAETLGMGNMAMLYNNLAVLFRRQKNFDKALYYIEKARKVNSGL